MKHFIATAAATFMLALPAQAGENSVDDFLKRFEDFSNDAQTLMESWAEELAPKLEDLMAKMGDLSAYHPPEVLPNGDIILRRKRPEEHNQTPDAPAPGETTDL